MGFYGFSMPFQRWTNLNADMFLPSQSSCSTSTAVPAEEGIGNQKSASILWCWCLVMKCKCVVCSYCMIETQFNNWTRLSLVSLVIAFSLLFSLKTTGHPSSRSKFSDSWALGQYVRWTRLGRETVGFEVWIKKRPIRNTTVGQLFPALTPGFCSVGTDASWYISFFPGVLSMNIEIKDDLFVKTVFQLFGLSLVFDLNLSP